MIKNFEEYTQPLSEDEKKSVLIMREMLEESARLGAGSIYNVQFIKHLQYRMPNIKWTPERVRKLINYARISGLIPLLIAGSKGYRLATTMEEVMQYRESLQGRQDAIEAVNLALDIQARDAFSMAQGNLFPNG